MHAVSKEQSQSKRQELGGALHMSSHDPTQSSEHPGGSTHAQTPGLPSEQGRDPKVCVQSKAARQPAVGSASARGEDASPVMAVASADETVEPSRAMPRLDTPARPHPDTIAADNTRESHPAVQAGNIVIRCTAFVAMGASPTIAGADPSLM